MSKSCGLADVLPTNQTTLNQADLF